ncbi:MAG: SIMPL domain-containing protein [Janthinobacterium lividum]
MNRRLIIASLILAGGVTRPAAAQQALTIAPAVPTLSVSAEGHVARAPDVADLSGGVVTTAPTAAAAMADNAGRMTAVVAAVRRAGIAGRDIQTSGLSLAPQYRYEDNRPPVLTGYQATNTVSLRLRNLPDAGRLLDTLVAAGANQINGPVFHVDAADGALDEARVAAVATARARAELYARAAGLKVRRIVSIGESGGEQAVPRPMMMMARAKVQDATPVVPGEVTLAVTVNMVFELE